MNLSAKEYQHWVQEIARETGAKRDGTGKNLIVPRCPLCGKSGGKFGIYIGPETARREPFMAHCFSCGKSTRTLGKLLETIGRMDLMSAPTTDITAPLQFVLGFGFPLMLIVYIKKTQVLSCYFILLVALIGLNLNYIEDYMRRVESS